VKNGEITGVVTVGLVHFFVQANHEKGLVKRSLHDDRQLLAISSELSWSVYAIGEIGGKAKTGTGWD